MDDYWDDYEAVLRSEVRRLRAECDSLRYQIEREGCAVARLGETTYECRADAPCGLCRLRTKNAQLRADLKAVIEAYYYEDEPIDIGAIRARHGL